jgi:hypothetical protein
MSQAQEYPPSRRSFAGLLDWFTTRAFRLETLDQYAVGYEEEAIGRFLAVSQSILASSPHGWSEWPLRRAPAGRCSWYMWSASS